MKVLDRLLSLGTKPTDDILKVQLTRQVNGLNVFYAFVATAAAVLIVLFIPHPEFLLAVQVLAAVIYISSIVATARGYVNVVRGTTIYVFEVQMFFAILLTNGWSSGVIFVVTVYPLLAALMEIPRFRHLVFGYIQVIAIFSMHFIFPEAERFIMRFYNLEPAASTVVSVMALVTWPLMAAVIIEIIFSENLRAREKQKTLLSEITVSNKKLEVYAERLRDESLRLQAEVNIARKIQTMVLPSAEEIGAVDSLEISCMMITADEVGGDYYDIIKVDDTVTIGIGDVTGHGLSSGIIMLMAETVIRTLAEMKVHDPAHFINVVNRVLYSNIKRIHEDRNMTLALISYRDGRCVVTGQHESIIVVRSSGLIDVYDTMDLGFYVGLMPDISAQVGQMEIRLNPGDLMVLYSDGITEAENPSGEQFGLDNIGKSVKRYAELPTDKILGKFMRDLYNFMGETVIQDDISLVVIRQK